MDTTNFVSDTSCTGDLILLLSQLIVVSASIRSTKEDRKVCNESTLLQDDDLTTTVSPGKAQQTQ
jgi:hypothetical protein